VSVFVPHGTVSLPVHVVICVHVEFFILNTMDTYHAAYWSDPCYTSSEVCSLWSFEIVMTRIVSIDMRTHNISPSAVYLPILTQIIHVCLLLSETDGGCQETYVHTPEGGLLITLFHFSCHLVPKNNTIKQ
jgi:hypothetical protein